VLTAKLGARGRSLLARVVQEARIAVVPFTDEHWPIAIDAYARFGKGQHAAGLNFGDCLTYAVASLASQPLLYVGEDFAKTDLPRA
jgi:ribonuclease VapC